MAGNRHIADALKHALIYGGAIIISKIVSFFMLPIYAHCLQAEGYGIVGMIDVMISVTTMLIVYGITGAMWRFYYERTTDGEQKALISTTLILMFLLVTAASIPLLLFHNQLAYLAFGRQELGNYVIIAAISFVFEMTSRTAEAYILIRQRSIIYSLLALLRLVLSLSLNIYFIVYCELGVLGFLYSSLICSFTMSVITHAYTFSFVGIHFDKSVVRETIGYSLPLLPGYVAMFARNNADRVLMRAFIGLAQVGAYEMLNNFVSLIGTFIVEPFSKSWDAKRFEICDKPEGPETLARMFTYQLALMLFVGLVLSLEIPLLLRLLTPKEFWQGGEVAFLMVIARILSACYYQMYFGLLHAKRTHRISQIQIICSLLDVILNIMLVPRFGIRGAAITSCITYSTQCTVAFLWGRIYYSIPFQWDKIVRILLITIVLFAAISQLSFERLGISNSLRQELASVVGLGMKSLHLDAIRNGMLVHYATNNISLCLEAVAKVILCFLFVPALTFLGILPRKLLSIRFLRNPFQTFSSI